MSRHGTGPRHDRPRHIGRLIGQGAAIAGAAVLGALTQLTLIGLLIQSAQAESAAKASTAAAPTPIPAGCVSARCVELNGLPAYSFPTGSKGARISVPRGSSLVRECLAEAEPTPCMVKWIDQYHFYTKA